MNAASSRQPGAAAYPRVLAPAAVFALGVALSATFTLSQSRGWMSGSEIVRLASIYGAGALIGMALAIMVVRFVGRPLSGHGRLLTIFALGLAATVLATGGLLALEYRIYYSQWHAPAFSRIWIWQQVFTTLGALYQYAVMGLRYYGAGAVVVLAATSWWASRTSH